MAFSGKADEIHKYMVSVGVADEWIGTAKGFIERKGQYEPGPPYKFDYEGLEEELKAGLSGAVSGATDSHWHEIARWLINAATPK
jgi:hypothetical protein